MAEKAFPTLKLKTQDPVTKKPIFSRTVDLNAAVTELKKLYKIELKLALQDGGAEQTVYIPCFTDTGPLEGGGGGGDSSPPIVYPFDMTVAPNASNPSTQIDVTFEPGTCAGLLPSSIFDVHTVANSGAYWVYLACTTANAMIDSCALTISASDPGDNGAGENAPPPNPNVLVGYILDGVAYNLLKQNAYPVANVLFQTDRTPPINPGEPAYDYYYAWSW